MKHILNRHKYRIFLLIFIISLLASLALSLESPQQICNSEKGCDIVQNSKYAFTLGIKNSDYGILIFSLMIVLTSLHMYKPSKHKRTMIHFSVIIGSLIALYLIFLQQFILKSYCKYCLVIDISLILAFTLLILTWKK